MGGMERDFTPLNGRRPWRRIRRATWLIVAVGALLTTAPAAMASLPSFTWNGRAPEFEEEWSRGSNWEGNTAPTGGQAVGALTFPRLTNAPCTSEPETEACYFSFNDLSGLSAESVQLDDGDEYFIGGETLALGAGGLTASPAASGPAGDVIELPLHLTASQTWSIADRPEAEIEENGLVLAGELTGSGNALTIKQRNGSALILANDTELGPVTIEGPNEAGQRIANGSVFLEGAELDASNAQPVDLRHIYFEGTGAVGALSSHGSTLVVGDETQPAGGLQAASLTLDSTSAVLFEVRGGGQTAQVDNSQIVSEGPVALAGSTIVEVGPSHPGGVCPVLVPGSTYTLLTTRGSLSGSFANAPEGGPEVPIDFAKGCSQTSQTMRIEYHRSAVATVTATVEADAVRRQKEATAASEASLKAAQEAAARANEEALAKRKHEEEAAKVGVLSTKETAKAATPEVTVASRSLTVRPSGAVTLKVGCPATESSCAGTVTLRTLGAVNADAAHSARKAILTLATGSFTMAGGQVKAITLHLSAKARALLGRSHLLHIRATILAHDPAGARHTTQATVTLHAPKSGHGKR